MHDIYDPPPAPVPWNPPKPDPIVYTTGDVACLLILFLVLFTVSALAWGGEATMSLFTAVGGALVILESWFTALSFLHRRRALGLRARWTVFFAALIPWLIGLGIAAMLMMGLFWVSDRLG